MFVELVYDSEMLKVCQAHAKSSSMNSQNAYINFFPMRK
ncbi:Uncharacterised protein [Salmonella enterica subsp. enterica serovar Sanjuan]|uniref:Uncharacterized protein n=1 Tax=Salmonella enterica subsp. enterica serovar Sanjuan TaxID=1160765 RepID=A0A3S4IX33_SALET|nr:Uncharacterised protein [Salmonella enterica subsp. enterica serovar Sanjuan]